MSDTLVGAARLLRAISVSWGRGPGPKHDRKPPASRGFARDSEAQPG